MGTARNCDTYYFAARTGTGVTDPFLTWIQDVLALPAAPIVQSVSFGTSEIPGASSHMRGNIGMLCANVGV